jgi:Spy/CpxP family protein refolding chaperone
MAHHEGGEEHDGGGRAKHGRGRGMDRARMAHRAPPVDRNGAEVMRELGAMGVHFYPPPVVLRRGKEIGLTPDQTTKIRAEMLATHSRGIDLHAKIEHSKVETARLLSADKVDEKAVLTQVDEGAKAEAEMHKLHVGTMLRVRALLTPEQRQKLEEHASPKPRHRAKPAHAQGPGPVGQADDMDDDEEDDDDDEAES